MTLNSIKLNDSPIVWDNHACPPMAVSDLPAFLPKLALYKHSGVNVVSLNIGYGEMSLSEHFTMIRYVRDWLSKRAHDYITIETLDDIYKAKQERKLGVVFDIEGVAPLDGNLGLVDEFYALGVRWMLLAYNRNNWAASGVHDHDAGLTPKGRALVGKMEDTGMVVCLSHTSTQTAKAVFEIATKPVIFSHSNPRTMAPHARNISDDLITACARTGGVVGINGLALFLGDGGATAQNVARHIEYVAELTSSAHVGLGLDYVLDLEGLEHEKAVMGKTFPSGCGYDAPTVCTSPETIPEIAERLLARNWKENEVRDVLGENWLRVARQCWKKAQARQDACAESALSAHR